MDKTRIRLSGQDLVPIYICGSIDRPHSAERRQGLSPNGSKVFQMGVGGIFRDWERWARPLKRMTRVFYSRKCPTTCRVVRSGLQNVVEPRDLGKERCPRSPRCPASGTDVRADRLPNFCGPQVATQATEESKNPKRKAQGALDNAPVSL